METWNAEFFGPGTPMLEAAPLLLIRGDHEKCERAGRGYFRFLDAGPAGSCTDFSDPYAIEFDEFRVVVMDTVQADDTSLSPDVVIRRYAEDFEKAASLSKEGTWLVSHRPIWALRPAAAKGVGKKDACLNQEIPDDLKLDDINVSVRKALAASPLRGTLPATVDLVLTAHIHVLEVLSFTGKRPPQAVVGISGTKLLPSVSESPVGLMIAGEKITDALMLSEHGFLGVQPAEAERAWRADVIDVKGKAIAECRIEDKRAVCAEK